MIFNLIGPLILKSDLAPLQHAIEDVGVAWPTGIVRPQLEYAKRGVFNEDSGQPTSIDLALLGEDTSIFIESKLVEKEFGGCSVFDRINLPFPIKPKEPATQAAGPFNCERADQRDNVDRNPWKNGNTYTVAYELGIPTAKQTLVEPIPPTPV